MSFSLLSSFLSSSETFFGVQGLVWNRQWLLLFYLYMLSEFEMCWGFSFHSLFDVRHPWLCSFSWSCAVSRLPKILFHPCRYIGNSVYWILGCYYFRARRANLFQWTLGSNWGYPGRLREKEEIRGVLVYMSIKMFDKEAIWRISCVAARETGVSMTS